MKLSLAPVGMMLMIAGCLGDVEVQGIPDQIELKPCFQLPGAAPKDAGQSEPKDASPE